MSRADELRVYVFPNGFGMHRSYVLELYSREVIEGLESEANTKDDRITELESTVSDLESTLAQREQRISALEHELRLAATQAEVLRQSIEQARVEVPKWAQGLLGLASNVVRHGAKEIDRLRVALNQLTADQLRACGIEVSG